MESKYVTYDEMCNRIKNIIFGYHNVEDRIKNNIFQQIIEESNYAHKEAIKMMKDVMGVDDETIAKIEDYQETHSLEGNTQEMVDKLVGKTIMEHTKGKTLEKDGYCLKVTLLHKAVQFKHDETMLGIITDFDDESTRFVYVDFGEAEGSVKMDLDELNY